VQILQLPTLRSSCHSRWCWTQLSALNYSAISSQSPWQGSTDWTVPIVFLITSRLGSHRKLRSSVVACVFVSAGTWLPSRCSETAVSLFAYCIATAVLVPCLEVFAKKQVYTPQYSWMSKLNSGSWGWNHYDVNASEHGTRWMDHQKIKRDVRRERDSRSFSKICFVTEVWSWLCTLNYVDNNLRSFSSLKNMTGNNHIKDHVLITNCDIFLDWESISLKFA
jgi:hypothetical protein